MIQSMTDRVLRWALTAGHLALRADWFVRRPRTHGAHALALTPDREVILVKLRYASGWRLPGGGRDAAEPAEEAVLRELREEIGMTAHGAVRPLTGIDPSLVVVEDVVYTAHRWSWEVERVIESDLGALPEDISPRAGRWLAAYRKLA